jgi:hypothetical protein
MFGAAWGALLARVGSFVVCLMVRNSHSSGVFQSQVGDRSWPNPVHVGRAESAANDRSASGKVERDQSVEESDKRSDGLLLADIGKGENSL